MNDPATNADFEQAHKRIRELIDRFEKHAAAYMQPTYQDLISPDPQPRVAGFAPPAAQHGAI